MAQGSLDVTIKADKHITLFIEKFLSYLEAGLQKKTGWGRNEILTLIHECIIKSLATVADRAIGEKDGKL